MNRTSRLRRLRCLATAAITAAALAIALGGCGDTGQKRVEYALNVVGNSQAKSFDAFGWHVDVSRAELMFGPLYLCASAGASADLCATARAELLEAVPVDLLAARPHDAGRVHGTSGSVQSAMFDFGITWTTTQQTPTPLPSLAGGHSLHIEGRASQGATSFAFSADVDLLPPGRDFRTVQGRRIEGDVESDNASLLVGFDVSAWLAQVNWDALAQQGDDPVAITTNTKAADALTIGVSAAAPPTFTFQGTSP